MSSYPATIILVISLAFSIADVSSFYAYIPTPMTVADAESYCLSTFNQHLATIITESDMTNALSTIAGRASPWIGLHNVKQEAGWFDYFKADQCPSDTVAYGACLGKEFWVEGKPRHCDYGSSCVTLYASGKINNDIKCQELQPFLCDTVPRTYVDSGLTGNWDEAYNYCLTHGGLASFVTPHDINNLEKVIDATGYTFAWIGLVQHSANGLDQDWYWLDGTACPTSGDLCTDLWSVGEPNGEPGHAWCECTSYGCKRTGCIRSGCIRTGCIRTGCIDSDCRRECVWHKESVHCDGGGHNVGSCCLKWKNICTCKETGCVENGCIENGCIESGCVDYGCLNYQCYTEDADCAAVESSSGLAADYHCTTNTAPIICNDESIINSAKVVSNSLLQDLVESENVWGLLQDEDFVKGVVVLLVMSCMVNICLFIGCGCTCRRRESKVKYESVDMEDMEKFVADK